MSTLKVGAIRGVSASSDAVTVANDGTCTANITNRTNKNLIINGAYQVAQRGTSSTSTGYQTVDRFDLSAAGVDEAMTQAQVDVSSGTTPYTLGFRKAFKITNGNQTGGAGTGDRCIVSTALEAQDIADSGWNYLSASSYITLSFWAKSSVAQTFYVALTSQDGTQQRYGVAMTFTSTNTWTKFTYKIPGNSNLQFDNNSDRGLQIFWTLFRGTDTTSNSFVLNQWAAYNGSIRYPDITGTWFTTNDATFEITGVQLEVGSVATDFEHRSFAQELALCQRYFYKTYDYDTAIGTATTAGAFVRSISTQQTYAAMSSVRYPVSMRDNPTVTAYSTQNANTTGKMSADSNDKDISIHYIGHNGHFPFVQNSSSGITSNVFLRHQFTAAAEL